MCVSKCNLRQTAKAGACLDFFLLFTVTACEVLPSHLPLSEPIAIKPSQLKGHECRQDVKCFWLKIGSHCTELYTFLSLSTSLSPCHQGTWGEFPEGHLLTAPAGQPQDTPQLSFNDKAWWDDTCGVICLHNCDFRVYVRCPCHFNSGAFPRCGYVSGLGSLDLPLFWGFPQFPVRG